MGAAIAKDWASLGAEVCVADINEEGIAAVAEEIRAAGGSATHISLDVTSEEQAKAAVAHVVAQFGEINLLLNNAGVNKPTIFPDTPQENYDFIMGVNAWGKFNVMKWTAQQMIDQGKRDYLEEGRRIRMAQADDILKLESIKSNKLRELNTIGIDQRYITSLERKKVLL